MFTIGLAWSMYVSLNVDLFLNKLKNLMGEAYIFLNETWKISCMVSFIEMGGVILEL